MDSQNQINAITDCIKDAYHTSIRVIEILFKHLDVKLSEKQETKNELISAIYLNKAISLMASAKAIYISNLVECENSYVEDIFHQFDVFSDELLTNLATNHSHQWTSIEYEKYKDLVTSYFNVN